MRFPAVLAPGVALLLGLTPACAGESDRCSPGTRLEGDACVAVCGAGAELDPRAGRCVPVCGPGMHRDPVTGACAPDAGCGDGEVWDAASSRCLDVGAVCAPPTVWVASESRCVPESELRVPELPEGPGDNDHGNVPPTCEPLPLPTVDGAVTLGGTIEEVRVVENGFGGYSQRPDTDCWAFDVEEPTLLRIASDGIGGLAPAFLVISLDRADAIVREAIGGQDRMAARDLFLVKKGRYGLVLTDAVNLHGAAGVFRGGEGMRYFAEVRRLPLPEPTPIAVGQDGLALPGVLPAVPPHGGSGLRFFSLAGAADELYRLELNTGTWAVHGHVAGINASGHAFEQASGEYPGHVAFAEAGAALFAVDFGRLTTSTDAPFELRLRREPMIPLEDDPTAWDLDQPAWSDGAPLPWRFFGFRATEGDVVTFRLGSDTGFGCFEIWSDWLGRLACSGHCWHRYRDPEFETEGWFRAPYTGLFLVRVYDWDRAWFEGESLLSIPAHTYRLETRLFRQTPVPLGDLAEPWAREETVTADEWERFFGLTPSAGDAFWFELEGRGDFEPVFASYWIDVSRRSTDNLYPDWYSLETAFAWRSLEGNPMLIGISDLDGSPGGFGFRAHRIEFAPAGSVAGGAPLETNVTLDAGEVRRFFRLDLAGPGWLRLRVRSSGEELRFMPLGADLSLVPELASNVRPGGFAELVHPLTAAPLFFELSSASGDPLAVDTAVTIEASLEARPADPPGNDAPERAHPVTVPVELIGDGREDVEWFSFEVTEPTTIDVITRRAGLGGVGGARFILFDPSGPCFESGCKRISSETEPGGMETLRGVPLEVLGRYTIRVDAWGSVDPGYLLEVRHAEP